MQQFIHFKRGNKKNRNPESFRNVKGAVNENGVSTEPIKIEAIEKNVQNFQNEHRRNFKQNAK
jgi:hypothetical protein